MGLRKRIWDVGKFPRLKLDPQWIQSVKRVKIVGDIASLRTIHKD